MKKKLIFGITLLGVFIIWTIGLLIIDRQAIGPNNSVVGYSTMNKWFFNLTGVNWILYNITDWGGIPPIFLGITFAVIGIIQLIKRKNILKVDIEILILGIFYIIVFLIYIIFDFVVINRRPVLINGYLEASYPSSTTFLSITFMLSTITMIKKYILNKKIKLTLILVAYLYMLFLVIGRMLSGVHWLSDILGSVFIGVSLVMFFEFAINYSEARIIKTIH